MNRNMETKFEGADARRRKTRPSRVVSAVALIFSIVAALSAGTGQGQARASSSGWYEADPNGSTNHSPAMADYNGHIVSVIHASSDNSLWWNVDSGPYHRLGDIVGANEHIYHGAMDANGTFYPWTEVPGGGRTEFGAAVTTSPDGHITVVHTGTDGNIYSQRGIPGTGTWDGYWSQMPGTTDTSPAVTYNQRNNDLDIGWRTQGNGQVEVIEASTSSAATYGSPHGVPAWDNVTSPYAPGLTSEGAAGIGVTISGSNITDVAGDYFALGHVYIFNFYNNL
jgi:hypothetical protein